MGSGLTLEELTANLRRAWSAETSSDPSKWTPENPAWGQCAVTALVVQDAFGGELMRGIVGQGSHYWNRLPDGSEVDLTLEQFGGAQPFDQRVKPREYVIGFPETKRRYELLIERVYGPVGLGA